MGTYDGYGRIGNDGHEDYDILEHHMASTVSIYHRACWELLGRPMPGEISEYADDQGFLFEPEDYDYVEPVELKAPATVALERSHG